MIKKALALGLVVSMAVPVLPAQQAPLTFTSNTTLVIVDVSVKDKSGKAVEDLKKGDFTLTEDGKAQQVAVFDFQKLDIETAPPVPATKPDAKPAAAPSKPATVTAAVTQTPQPAPAPKPAAPAAAPAAKPAEKPLIRYQDRRLVAMLFDMSTLEVADQIRVQKTAIDFIHKSLKPADLVSILVTTTGPLEVAQDFTDDKDALESAVKKFRIGEGSDLADNLGAGDTSDDNTFSADQSEFDIFNVDKKLTTIETSCKMLSSFPEKKALMYFSGGITQNGTDNQAELVKAVNVCKKSNVSIDPIDARGMTASAPGGDASTSSGRGGSTLFTAGGGNTSGGGRGGAANDSSQETLSTLASDTGGRLFAEDNDLTTGLEQARDDIGSYYILGYYSTNGKLDGKYRTVSVKIGRQDLASAKLDYRHGYFAEKDFSKFSSADKDAQLEQALILGDPITDLTLAAEVNYFRLARDRYFVPLSVKIPGAEIALAKSKGNAKTDLDFIAQLRNGKDQIQSQVADTITIQLAQSSLTELNNRAIAYDTGFAVPPGSYKLKFLTRENETGKMGTYEKSFVIPDLATDQPATIKTSSIVLSSQRQATKGALAKADPNSKLTDANPLVEDGQQLVPSITRVFRKDQNLYVYMEVYDPTLGTDQKPSVAAILTFFRGKNIMSQSQPVRLDTFIPQRGQTLPVRFQVPLSSLPTGAYTCQINLIDENGHKFGFQRADIKILPASGGAAAAAPKAGF
ncbi:MAG TPA: VWA domain-containing protein [Bryobacteraceae bacterium]|nr:VWA domain-containing protein [Bryobacteraceae bacterium]